MQFNAGDIVILVLYFGITFVIGMAFTRRAGSGLSEYFLSGRSAPWWLAGTGMVATTFAADTPLWVAGQVARYGTAGNWLWWSSAAGGMLTVFFFARLWRRAGVLTDLEFIEIRYDGPLMPWLRGIKSIYFGLVINCLVIAWVCLAMIKIFEVTLPDVNPQFALTLCAVITVIYVSFSGLWGVAIADLFQFTIAMGGCILLAVLALRQEPIAGAGGLTAVLPPDALRFLPVLTWPAESAPSAGRVLALSPLTFLAFVGVQWWASWYPGAEPGGGGYIAQRIMSARDEKQGLLATLWFVTAHYCLRSWPWILAGLAAVVLFPHLRGSEQEKGYVYLMREVLPSPFRGLLLAAFIGAFMSTLSTQLNWGGSYLVNDFYRRFIRTRETEHHYLRVSRLITVLLLVVALLVSFFVLKSISQAWEFMLEFGAGTGFVLILRWYWWRLNATAELFSLLSSIVAVLFLRGLWPLIWGDDSPWLSWARFPLSLFIIVPFNITVTLLVAFLSPAAAPEKLMAFYRRVHPAGPGWKMVRDLQAVKADSGEGREGGGRADSKPAEGLAFKFLGWVAGTALVYLLLFGLGSFFFGRFGDGLLLLGLALPAGALTAYAISREFDTI